MADGYSHTRRSRNLCLIHKLSCDVDYLVVAGGKVPGWTDIAVWYLSHLCYFACVTCELGICDSTAVVLTHQIEIIWWVYMINNAIFANIVRRDLQKVTISNFVREEQVIRQWRRVILNCIKLLFSIIKILKSALFTWATCLDRILKLRCRPGDKVALQLCCMYKQHIWLNVTFLPLFQPFYHFLTKLSQLSDEAGNRFSSFRWLIHDWRRDFGSHTRKHCTGIFVLRGYRSVTSSAFRVAHIYVVFHVCLYYLMLYF